MKFLTTIVLLVGLVALLPAQKVIVTAPQDGAVWGLGQAKWITWDANGFTGTVQIEMVEMNGDSNSCALPYTGPMPLATDQKIKWRVGDQGVSKPSLPPGVYQLCIYQMGGNNDGDWSKSVTFSIVSLTFPKLKHFRFIEYRWPPLPGPDPCLCPEFDLKPLKEVFAKVKSPISIVLMKNGQQLQQLGSFAGSAMLPASLKAKLSQGDFNLLKSGKAKFTLAVLGARGKILNQFDLRSQTTRLRR